MSQTTISSSALTKMKKLAETAAASASALAVRAVGSSSKNSASSPTARAPKRDDTDTPPKPGSESGQVGSPAPTSPPASGGQSRIESFAARSTSAPGTTALPQAREILELARELRDAGLTDEAIDVALLTPSIVPPGTPFVQLFQVLREMHVLLKELYTMKGHSLHADHHDAMETHCDLALATLGIS